MGTGDQEPGAGHGGGHGPGDAVWSGRYAREPGSTRLLAGLSQVRQSLRLSLRAARHSATPQEALQIGLTAS